MATINITPDFIHSQLGLYNTDFAIDICRILSAPNCPITTLEKDLNDYMEGIFNRNHRDDDCDCDNDNEDGNKDPTRPGVLDLPELTCPRGESFSPQGMDLTQVLMALFHLAVFGLRDWGDVDGDCGIGIHPEPLYLIASYIINPRSDPNPNPETLNARIQQVKNVILEHYSQDIDNNGKNSHNNAQPSNLTHSTVDPNHILLLQDLWNLNKPSTSPALSLLLTKSPAHINALCRSIPDYDAIAASGDHDSSDTGSFGDGVNRDKTADSDHFDQKLARMTAYFSRIESNRGPFDDPSDIYTALMIESVKTPLCGLFNHFLDLGLGAKSDPYDIPTKNNAVRSFFTLPLIRLLNIDPEIQDDLICRYIEEVYCYLSPLEQGDTKGSHSTSYPINSNGTSSSMEPLPRQDQQ